MHDLINVSGIPGFREPVSCFSHLVAAVVFAVLGIFLLRRGRGCWRRTLSLAVLVFASVFLLSMSATYHMLPHGPGREVMRRLDVAAVFVLIAGTATPIHVILFHGVARWLPLLLMWSVAATGITLRTVFAGSLPVGLGSTLFLMIGWMGLVSCIVLWRRHGFWLVEPLLWGGVAYTVGVIVQWFSGAVLIPQVVGPHELWHIAVLVGLSLHWKFVFSFASGTPVLIPSAATHAAGQN